MFPVPFNVKVKILKFKIFLGMNTFIWVQQMIFSRRQKFGEGLVMQ